MRSVRYRTIGGKTVKVQSVIAIANDVNPSKEQPK